MMKYHLKFLSAILLFSSFFLWQNYALAASAPTDPRYEFEEVTHDYIAVDFSWDRNLDPGVGWYHLVYRCTENCSGGNATWVPQPSSGNKVSKLFVGGFEFSLPTLAKKYEWQVGACSSQDQGACAYSPAQEFETPLQPPPEGGGGNGGGGNGGNGGGTPVDLPRPISAQNLDELFSAIIKFLFVLAFAIGPLMIVYAGFLILTAGGDIRKLNLAKTIILWTLVSLTVISLARGAPSIVKGLLGG